ncbi:MAG: 23S rRNA pseudouridine(955/2504/2580) synthase RluC [Gammaproteobacteria bacterium]|nr:23S rRNA pseudouridine(955/2504/2580) synthase RluC [Gammaproteobacteria bacterium]MCK5092796.1 23S rRNA pseudouridine(955/2504/2580) synthase RluC [Gammaproteobacteria bacterium]
MNQAFVENSNSVQMLTVTSEFAGQRIDNFLFRRLKGVPKTRIYRILRKGEVRVNKGRIRPNYRLKDGDTVRIPPIRQSQPDENKETRIPRAILTQLDQATLFENDDVLVLDKPSGLAVHAGSGLGFGLIEAIRQLRPDANFLELVHRLDRDTSGCLVLAKNRASLLALHEQFRESGMAKKYLALLAGSWNFGDKTVSAPLMKNTLKGGERMVQVSQQGKPSVSHFHPVNIFSDASLMEVRLETGRTHQIRVHARHIGHPVVGDSKYGDTEINRKFQKQGLKRLFLHAHSIEFTLPSMHEGETLLISAPLPAELKMVLNKLEGHS